MGLHGWPWTCSRGPRGHSPEGRSPQPGELMLSPGRRCQAGVSCWGVAGTPPGDWSHGGRGQGTGATGRQRSRSCILWASGSHPRWGKVTCEEEGPREEKAPGVGASGALGCADLGVPAGGKGKGVNSQGFRCWSGGSGKRTEGGRKEMAHEE